MLVFAVKVRSVGAWLGFRQGPGRPTEAPIRAAAIQPGASACPPAALPLPCAPGTRLQGPGAPPRSLHVGPPPARPAPARISILNRRLSVPQPRPALLPELPGPWEWRRLRSHRTVQKRPEDASGPGAIDNEAAGAAARPGPCAPRPHLPARPSLRLTVLPPFRRSAHPPRWRMAGRPRPGPQHSGRAAHGLVGARGALPAA